MRVWAGGCLLSLEIDQPWGLGSCFPRMPKYHNKKMPKYHNKKACLIQIQMVKNKNKT